HNAGNSDRLRGIRDDEIFRCEFAGLTVESLNRLTRASAANDNRAPLKRVEIERVSRVTHFVQGVVAGICDFVDRPLIDQFQSASDVCRRWCDLNAANYTGGVTGTACDILDDDREVSSLLFGELWHDWLQVEVIDRRGLARDTEMVHGVGPIGRDLGLIGEVLALTVEAFDGDTGLGEPFG